MKLTLTSAFFIVGVLFLLLICNTPHWFNLGTKYDNFTIDNIDNPKMLLSLYLILPPIYHIMRLNLIQCVIVYYCESHFLEHYHNNAESTHKKEIVKKTIVHIKLCKHYCIERPTPLIFQ